MNDKAHQKKTGKGASRSGSGKPTRAASAARREGVRQILAADRQPWIERLFSSPGALTGLVVGLAFIIVGATIATVFRGSLLPAPGRIATESILSRVDFSVEDPQATDRARESARQNAPPVYTSNTEAMIALDRALDALPEALAATESFEQVTGDVVASFDLSPEAYEVIKREAADGDSSGSWENAIGRAVAELSETALLTSQAYQRIYTSGYNELTLVAPDADGREGGWRTNLRKDDALALDADGTTLENEVRDALTGIANRSGLYGPSADVFVARVLSDGEPTYRLDREATDAARESAVMRIETVTRGYSAGEVIVRAGTEVDRATYDVAVAERRAFAGARGPWGMLVHWMGLAGLVAIIGLVGASYLHLFRPDLLGKPWRLAALAGLLVGAMLLSSWIATAAPHLKWGAVLAPSLYAGMVASVVYDRRFAVLVGLSSLLLTALSLGLGESTLLAGLIGIAVATWRLAGLRSRNDVVRAGLVTTAAVAIGVVLVGLAERSLSWAVLRELLADGAIAGAGAFFGAAMLLVTMPTIEHVFDVTTGMTLAELRDPQHPLLRQLQQRAPGTYNHALNVATIAESAADAIGANALHAYVGAVYHDIGKMNKPDYFVENQSPGINKHSNLSPAMSLLVIVGHVKDGVELAREYGLPESLHHYIESHHGTTLVEFFYERAKKQADADDTIDRPAEFEYRYPGPKPRTREAAILMLADASESAARSLGEPTPARIEALVMELSRKRLLDGQFDECEITLRELTLIENAITRSLTSIYHGRIA